MFSPDFTNYGLRRVTAKQFTQTLPGQTKVVTKKPENKKLPPQPPIEDDEEDDNNSQISDASNSSPKTRQHKGQKTQNKDSVDKKNSVTSQQDVTDDFRYYCSKCSYKIDEVTKFECHWADVHKKIYVCRIDPCTKWYQTSAGLRQHVYGHHAAVLTCEHCGVICLDPFLLKDHMAKHDNANFVCSRCEKDFTCNDDKNRHYKYRCPANPNRFTKCKHCIRAHDFPDVPGAEADLMTHLAEKHGMKGQYLCVNCHSLFTMQKIIDTHQKKCKKNHSEI